jgi:hypothetical protein
MYADSLDIACGVCIFAFVLTTFVVLFVVYPFGRLCDLTNLVYVSLHLLKKKKEMLGFLGFF